MADNEVPILSRLRAPKGANRGKLRVGRGPASGHGKTGGRGQKGQKARQPGNIHKLAFEGGQMPLVRRIPKRGFSNLFAKTVAEVNVRDLAKFDDGAVVDVAALLQRGLVKGRFDVVKVLGEGELDKKLTVRVHRFSKTAFAKIEGAGGTAEVVSELELSEQRHPSEGEGAPSAEPAGAASVSGPEAAASASEPSGSEDASEEARVEGEENGE
jgi:large subunit ribosomal protein L15